MTTAVPAGRVHRGERCAVLDRVADGDWAAGIVGIRHPPLQRRPRRCPHARRRLPVFPSHARDVLTRAQTRRRSGEGRTDRRVRRAPPQREDPERGVLLVADAHPLARGEVGEAGVAAGRHPREAQLDRQRVDDHEIVERHVAVVAHVDGIAVEQVEHRRVRETRRERDIKPRARRLRARRRTDSDRQQHRRHGHRRHLPCSHPASLARSDDVPAREDRCVDPNRRAAACARRQASLSPSRPARIRSSPNRNSVA